MDGLGKEIGRYDGLDVRVDKRVPRDAGDLGGGVGSWLNTRLPQNLANRAGSDREAKFLEFAKDAPIAPLRILARNMNRQTA